MGIISTLPQGFVDRLNRVAGPPIWPDIVEISSPMLVWFRWTAPLYALYVIPRYTIAAVFLTYLIWADLFAASKFWRGRVSMQRSTPVDSQSRRSSGECRLNKESAYSLWSSWDSHGNTSNKV